VPSCEPLPGALGKHTSVSILLPLSCSIQSSHTIMYATWVLADFYNNHSCSWCCVRTWSIQSTSLLI
jgi:hypothetical protein